jgi:hypothetical protein
MHCFKLFAEKHTSYTDILVVRLCDFPGLCESPQLTLSAVNILMTEVCRDAPEAELPRQRDGVSCGAYMLAMMLRLATNGNITADLVTDAQMPQLRQQLVENLWTGILAWFQIAAPAHGSATPPPSPTPRAKRQKVGTPRKGLHHRFCIYRSCISGTC